MKQGTTIWLDKSLDVPSTGAEVRVRDLRDRAGPRNAAILGLLTFARETQVIPVGAMLAAVRESPIGQYIPDGLLNSFESEHAQQ
jgi:hypothetical protein